MDIQKNNTKVIAFIIGVIIVAAGAIYFIYFRDFGSSSNGARPSSSSLVSPVINSNPAPDTQTQSNQNNPAAVSPVSPSPAPLLPSPKPIIIEMTLQGFSPVSVTMPVGTAVRFVNRDSVGMWPASDIHPTHGVCPGFDSLGPVAPGETYEFTFTEAKTCPMHDHLHPRLKGAIVVQ